MFKLDNNFLNDIGLGSLPDQDKAAMLRHIYETLELRVGMRLAEQMTDAQLDEFEAFIDKNDEAGAKQWLDTNLPQYKQVVAEELEKLKNEIKASAPQILAANQQAAAQATQAQAPITQPQAPVDNMAQMPPQQPQPQPAQDQPQPPMAA
ncbi:hypothetical protein KC878_01255 [Candidatus Saccharibacteria bacterium]|nr:hypothetical protein [Candidatus Saccharibacteria bacterium]MCB9821289.1 hypothetical protein [Candidatus Nomurabacteria bacterium]